MIVRATLLVAIALIGSVLLPVMLALFAAAALLGLIASASSRGREAVPWAPTFLERYTDPVSLAIDQVLLGLRHPETLVWRASSVVWLALPVLMAVAIADAVKPSDMHSVGLAVGAGAWSVVVLVPHRLTRLGVPLWVPALVLWAAELALVGAALIHVGGDFATPGGAGIFGAVLMALADLFGVALVAGLAQAEHVLGTGVWDDAD